MTYMDKKFGVRVAAQDNGSDAGKATREALVLVIEDDYKHVERVSQRLRMPERCGRANADRG